MYYDQPKKKPRKKTPPAIRQERITEERRMTDMRAEASRQRRRQRREERAYRARARRLRRQTETAAAQGAYAAGMPAAKGVYAPPSPFAPKKRSRHLLLKFVTALLLCVLTAGFALYLLPVSIFGGHDENTYGAAGNLPGGYTHILLIGADVDGNGTSRSDTMLIASVGKGRVTLTTLMRDTGVTIPGHEGTHRLNAAYAYGGAELLLRTVNENFKMDISRYALVDYDTFPALIDALGGVTMNVSAAEMNEINGNMKWELYRQYKAGRMPYDVAYAKYERELLSEYGDGMRLDGLQAMAYARIRSLDSDYGRTGRQRAVLTAMLSSAKRAAKTNPAALIRFMTGALKAVNTNLTTAEILSAGIKTISAGELAQLRLPAGGTFTDDGGMFHDVNYDENRARFVSFVYGD